MIVPFFKGVRPPSYNRMLETKVQAASHVAYKFFLFLALTTYNEAVASCGQQKSHLVLFDFHPVMCKEKQKHIKKKA